MHETFCNSISRLYLAIVTNDFHAECTFWMSLEVHNYTPYTNTHIQIDSLLFINVCFGCKKNCECFLIRFQHVWIYSYHMNHMYVKYAFHSSQISTQVRYSVCVGACLCMSCCVHLCYVVKQTHAFTNRNTCVRCVYTIIH